jgi:hypothetical protein
VRPGGAAAVPRQLVVPDPGAVAGAGRDRVGDELALDAAFGAGAGLGAREPSDLQAGVLARDRVGERLAGAVGEDLEVGQLAAGGLGGPLEVCVVGCGHAPTPARPARAVTAIGNHSELYARPLGRAGLQSLD